MSKELTLTGDFEKGLEHIEKIERAIQVFLKNPAYKKYGYDGICAIVARAKALNLDPFQALNNGFYVVSGKIGMSTEMMAALVRRAGHSISKDPESTNEKVILHGKRSDNGDTWTSIYTKEDAIIAGLWGSTTWKKYPAIMLYNRAMSTLFRQLFPDLSLGAGYTPDEVDEITKTGDYSKDLSEADVEEITHLASPEQVEHLKSLLDKIPDQKKEVVSSWITAKGFKDFENMTKVFYQVAKNRLELTIDSLKEESKEDSAEILPY